MGKLSYGQRVLTRAPFGITLDRLLYLLPDVPNYILDRTFKASKGANRIPVDAIQDCWATRAGVGGYAACWENASLFRNVFALELK